MAALAERLVERREEIEQTILARVYSLEDPTQAEDPEYALGLKAAVCAGVSCGLAAIEDLQAPEAPIPPQLLSQARRAARSGVGLDTVLRRYVAGHTLLCDYLLQEASAAPGSAVQGTLRSEGALLDRMLVAVAAAYRDEVDRRHCTTEHRRAEQVKKLLAGEPQDAVELGYDLELWHLGVLASGAEAPRALRGLATALDRRLLVVRPAGREVWGWLGGHRRLAANEVTKRVRADWRSDLVLAIGDPGRGPSGWRLSHRQAKAALPIALRSAPGVVHYADVALLAAALADEVLARSLEDSYLAPLALERDDGAALRQALRAYFSAERNVTAAAAALGVSRPTVASRLRTVEERIGRPLGSCAAEIETVLRLQDLDRLNRA